MRDRGGSITGSCRPSRSSRGAVLAALCKTVARTHPVAAHCVRDASAPRVRCDARWSCAPASASRVACVERECAGGALQRRLGGVVSRACPRVARVRGESARRVATVSACAPPLAGVCARRRGCVLREWRGGARAAGRGGTRCDPRRKFSTRTEKARERDMQHIRPHDTTRMTLRGTATHSPCTGHRRRGAAQMCFVKTLAFSLLAENPQRHAEHAAPS